jgi:Zn-dependent membrane protease YugP
MEEAMNFFDMDYLIMVMIPSLILSGLAQMFVSSAFSKWKQIPNSAGSSGPETAQTIMNHANLDVSIESVPQEMGDHYDPQSNIMRLSPSVGGTDSVASMAIVAHELGHAQQDQTNSLLMWARNFLVPAVQLSPTIAYGLIITGLMMNIAGVMWLGIAVFGLTVLFMLLTLPVEIDASLRALRMLEETGLIRTEQDRQGARQMLMAAAFTYVAAAISSVLTLLYYISLANRRRRSY